MTLVRWLTPDLAATVTRFRDRWGFHVEDDSSGASEPARAPSGIARVRLANAAIALTENTRSGTAGGLELVQGAWERLAVERDELAATEPVEPPQVHPNGAADLVAIGWATIDHGRALGLEGDRAGGGSREESRDRLVFAGIDPLLGAGAWLGFVAEAADAVDAAGAAAKAPRAPSDILLEPAREGPLTAALARNGEAPVALYVRVRRRRWDSLRGELAARGTTVRGPVESPLGEVVLVRPERPWGPFVLFVRVPSPGEDAGDRRTDRDAG